MKIGFKCGHPHTAPNIKKRWKKVREGVWKQRAECRTCYNKRMRQVNQRARTRRAEFKEQLETQFPTADLPTVESCKGDNSAD